MQNQKKNKNRETKGTKHTIIIRVHYATAHFKQIIEKEEKESDRNEISENEKRIVFQCGTTLVQLTILSPLNC